MERFLVALDCTPGSTRCVQYLNRVLRGAEHAVIILFHVLPTTSPNMLKEEEVERITAIQHEKPYLAGYFWKEEDEAQMSRSFEQSRQLFIQGGFAQSRIIFHFNVQSADVAQIILDEARDLGCGTIVVGRRRLSRVKELLLGSVSNTVVKLAPGVTVWVVD